ncbi:hypothetical protein RFI_23791 [Reticulomyxa filosa]|uniref:G domain-containing protein n=1 Tax=Reticulomyxa filosa TaxID=46433 RepID=X6MKH9_RETFI|nr:hypothetical protein RFI_23791 [Reticulomyxa filosa]|eukprot:ETO13580.1 hypothetical protein RFI_23791 [Reticulomyxa filosa]
MVKNILTRISYNRKGALISLLRQFRLLHQGDRTLSVGVIGYPNSGKSSLINTLVGKPSCSVAPIPGQTKVWQYISLFDKFYLIDCPGIVYPRPGDDPVTKVLRSVVRVELIEEPMIYVEAVLTRVRKEYLQRVYELEEWTDSYDFMKQLAQKRGKLLKGGEPDYHNIAVAILHDWQRGRLPWFVSPPFEDDLELQAKLIEMEEELDKQKKKEEEEGDLEKEYQPIDTIANVNQAHDFFLDDAHMDIKEKEFLEDEGEGDVEMKDNEPALDIAQFGAKERQEIEKISVDNPLKLPPTDPLVLEMKVREWMRKNGKLTK